MPMTQTIDMDIRGRICPSCLLLALRALNQNEVALRAGTAEVAVLTDHRQATATIPSMAERMGYCVEVIGTDDGYRIRVFGSV